MDYKSVYNISSFLCVVFSTIFLVITVRLFERRKHTFHLKVPQILNKIEATKYILTTNTRAKDRHLREVFNGNIDTHIQCPRLYSLLHFYVGFYFLIPLV